MSAVDEIINYKRSEDEDFYKLLGCDENSTVSLFVFNFSLFIYAWALDFNNFNS